MNEITVTLSGRKFSLPKLTIRAETTWRREAKATMAPLLQAGDLATLEISNAADIARAVAAFGEWLDPMTALETLIAYAPAVLRPEQEWLEEHAYSDEVIGELLRLFFIGPPQRQTRRANGAAPVLSATI
jgi:hypothetical protein